MEDCCTTRVDTSRERDQMSPGKEWTSFCNSMIDLVVCLKGKGSWGEGGEEGEGERRMKEWGSSSPCHLQE